MPDIDLSGALVQSSSPVVDAKNYAASRPSVDEYEITVTGDAAGDSPNVILFRRFRSDTGDTLSLAPPAGEIGTLLKSDAPANPYYLDSDGFKSIANRRGNNPKGWFYITFAEAHEFRLALSEKVPLDKAIAGNGARETTPSGSNCKSGWIMRDNDGSGVSTKADLCVPTYVSGNVQVQGNASQPYGAGALYTFTDGFDFFGWNHTDHYQKADETNPTTGNGDLMTMFTSAKTGASKTTGTKTVTATAPVHGSSTTVQAASSAFNYLKVWSYCLTKRAGQPNTHLSLMTVRNLYLATGANAKQCVYLLNAATLSASTFKTPVAATSWDNVTGKIRIAPDAWEMSEATHYGLLKSNGTWQIGEIAGLPTV